jgi:hypothetical protein
VLSLQNKVFNWIKIIFLQECMGYISTDTLKEILRELDNKLTGTSCQWFPELFIPKEIEIKGTISSRVLLLPTL